MRRNDGPAIATIAPRVHWAIRLACVVNGAFYFVLGLGLYVKAPWAVALWPWPDVGMSYVFLASIAAAIGAPSIWIGLTGEFAAFAGIGLNTLVVNIGAAIYFAVRMLRSEAGLAPAISVCIAFAVAGALLCVWAQRLPVRDPRPMPAIVRIAFVGFMVTLLVAGSALAFQVPRIFPWNLSPQSSTIFGLIFLGAATYFAHGILYPRWAFAAGQLWSFFSYNLVLFVPYFGMLFSDSSSQGAFDDYGGGADSINVLSLTIYLTVLTVSTLLALYMFFVHPLTRIIGKRSTGD